jgi:hypothetical protein
MSEYLKANPSSYVWTFSLKEKAKSDLASTVTAWLAQERIGSTSSPYTFLAAGHT